MTFLDILSALWRPRATFNKAFNDKETFNNLDGHKYYTWRAVRRQNLNHMTSSIYWLIFNLVVAATTGTDQRRVRPDKLAQMRSTGGDPYYGIIHQLAIFAWWGVMLFGGIIFAILYFPIFKWLNSTPTKVKETLQTVTDKDGLSREITVETSTGAWYHAESINKYAYYTFAALQLAYFLRYLRDILMHVDARPVSDSCDSTCAIDHRKNWYTRLGLLFGMLAGLGLGAVIMTFWSLLDLVHFTYGEYAVIVVPTQLIIGLTVASILQAWYELDRQLPTERDLFEKDAQGELTTEGLRQAMSFLVDSDIDMKTLKDVATRKRAQNTNEKN